MSLACLSSANCLQALLCIIFRRGFLLGRQPYSHTEHWQADPPPLQPLLQCWQHSYVYSQTQPLYMMLSTCTQLLWSTMAGPVLSGTCPVKPLCRLGHRGCSSVSGSWQTSYSLYHLYVEQQFFFQILREFFAMRCHVELPVTSMREW